MITLRLTASLAALVSDVDNGEAATPGQSRSIVVDADNWGDTVTELRERFTALAAHLFDSQGLLRKGFLVARNDEVIRQPTGPATLAPGDEVFIFVQLAGG